MPSSAYRIDAATWREIQTALAASGPQPPKSQRL